MTSGGQPATGASSTPTSVMADPRAYMQLRVATYAKWVFIFFGGITLLMQVLELAIDYDNARFPLSKLVGMWVPPLLFAGAWQYVRRGQRSEMLLRAVEVVLTLVTCLMVGLAPIDDPRPGVGVMGVVTTSAAIGSLLILRAAVVPSTPWVSFIVSLAGGTPSVIATLVRWDLEATMASLEPHELGAIVTTLVMLMFAAVAAIVSMIVHGLQRRVREAMQLGQYTLEEKIGEGGMGAVYKARHALLRRPTAIKLLPPDKAGDSAIARFEREVQQTSRLTHPNTVAIYDYGHTGDGVFYYAMEYLDGISLDELAELDGPQPAARVVHLIAQAADALAEAHGIGLIHRDVKPANIVLCKRGDIADVVKVLDFGLVKDIAAPKGMALSATATITGTPLYLAPESLTEPDAVDGRTDIYALGGVAYYLLTGEHVFDGRTMVEVCGHHLHTEPTPPSERLGEAVDAELEAVVLRCLAKKQDDRPQTAAELRAALMACSAVAAWSRDEASTWWDERTDAIAQHQSQRQVGSSSPAAALTVAPEVR